MCATGRARCVCTRGNMPRSNARKHDSVRRLVGSAAELLSCLLLDLEYPEMMGKEGEQ